MVHEPLAHKTLAGIRRSTATGLPYGSAAWTSELAEKLK